MSKAKDPAATWRLLRVGAAIDRKTLSRPYLKSSEIIGLGPLLIFPIHRLFTRLGLLLCYCDCTVVKQNVTIIIVHRQGARHASHTRAIALRLARIKTKT